MKALKVMGYVDTRLICLFFAVIIAIGLGFLFGNYHVVTHELPVRSGIDRAIIVSRLDNEVSFKDMQPGIFSGAGAGGLGMGAPQVICNSVEQFLRFIPKNEPIYVSFQRAVDSKGSVDAYTIKKVYWAFMENRSGLWVYEDVYNYQEGSSRFRVSEYNNEKIVFIYDPGIERESTMYFIAFFFGGIGCIVLFVIGFWNLIPDIRYAMKHWQHI